MGKTERIAEGTSKGEQRANRVRFKNHEQTEHEELSMTLGQVRRRTFRRRDLDRTRQREMARVRKQIEHTDFSE